ncbi:HAD family hydrolase [Larkinella humicola]|uniref:HAD family phosphatase n=1 Tax=Larkinella humicola TaxID=2607654 RepID=A0A5N1JJW0_9BACT|nr:HAD family phosphatase [Larkinella humicola]KAA9356444.1 HAD family phosphatase [Larkinella humicola]
MINTIVFDLGAVLIDWNPHYLYKKIFKEDEMHHFLATVCTPAWNEEQDGGRSLAEATQVLIAQFPEHEENIRLFYDRWPEMLRGEIPGTVELLKTIRDSGNYKLYALTNWSSETFPIALERFEFLSWFDGIVVSGDEKDRKPFPSFYRTLLSRYSIEPNEALFIDDNLRNVKAAEDLGIHAIHFVNPEQLKEQFIAYGVPV